MMTNADVQQMYHEFNRRYFSNKLPKDMVVHFARLPHDFGITYGYRGRPLYIELDYRLRRSMSETAMTLLHECVHVENMKHGHGPKFHKRMLKLAKQGAFRKWW
jgi:SprT-like family